METKAKANKSWQARWKQAIRDGFGKLMMLKHRRDSLAKAAAEYARLGKEIRRLEDMIGAKALNVAPKHGVLVGDVRLRGQTIQPTVTGTKGTDRQLLGVYRNKLFAALGSIPDVGALLDGTLEESLAEITARRKSHQFGENVNSPTYPHKLIVEQQ
jgi:hypothetical protein